MNDPDDEESVSDGVSQIRALVATAEDIMDPLEGLVERSKVDAGEPFQPDVLSALWELRQSNQPQFERTRAELKRVGIPVARLDAAMTQAQLRRAARDGPLESLRGGDVFASLDEMAFFHSPDGRAFADIDVEGHRETHAIETARFADWLAHEHYAACGMPPAQDELKSAIGLARYRAKFDGPERQVHVRVAESDGRFYVDLGDPIWRAIEVSRGAWTVVDEPPVRFIRPPGYGELPEPQRGGSLDLLRPHLNLRDENDFVLIAAWLIAAIWPSGPYPVLALSGEQGTAKSTLTRYLKLLVDPNAVSLRPMPRNEQELFIAATNSHVLAFDNLSRVPGGMSDALCRLATGGGFSARRLYTDNEESLLNACRPVVVNAIDDVIMRADLADRAVFIELARIDDGARQPETVLHDRFYRERPRILGALLDALAHGLREVDTVHLDKLPRMADFAVRAVASEGAFAVSGTFLAAFDRNRNLSIENVIDRDVVASAVVALLANQVEWRGTATGLLRILFTRTDEAARRSHVFPQTASHLSGSLKRLATPLRAFGIEIETHREGHHRQRVITLKRTNVDSSASVATEQGAGRESSRSDGDA